MTHQEPKDFEFPSKWAQREIGGIPIKIAFERAINYDDKEKKPIVGPLRSKPFRDLFVFVNDNYWSIQTMKRLCQQIADQKNAPDHLKIWISNSEEDLIASIKSSLLPWKIQQISKMKTVYYSRRSNSILFIYEENGKEIVREEKGLK